MSLTCLNSQKVLDAKKADQPPLDDKLYSTCISGWKVLDMKKAKQSFPLYKRSQKVNNTKIIPSITTGTYVEDIV